MNARIVIYKQGELSIIDTINSKTGRGTYSKKTIEEIRIRYPGAELVPFDYAIDCINESAKDRYKLLEPVEIDKDRFWEMLECLPPEQWQKSELGESFKMSERTFADITACFVKKDNRYYEVNARINTPHETLCSVCV